MANQQNGVGTFPRHMKETDRWTDKCGVTCNQPSRDDR